MVNSRPEFLRKEQIPMSKWTRCVPLALVALMAIVGCKGKETQSNEPESFSFVVYPGSRYLAQLTEVTKNAHKIIQPNQDPPPTAIYDTDASVETVAAFYAKEYDYKDIAADATNNLSSAKPPAYYRSGDLQTDVQAALPVAEKLNLKVDATKAQGKYRAAEIEPKPNRPRVTIQRPYFDMTTSQLVDRTMILMSR
jgi:hypothetical protein